MAGLALVLALVLAPELALEVVEMAAEHTGSYLLEIIVQILTFCHMSIMHIWYQNIHKFDIIHVY